MKRRSLLSLLLLLIVSSMIGCASQRMYYWGDYSETLYAMRKDTNDETLLKHQKTLEQIIVESNSRNLRVPPGVYAELGYIYFRQNKNDTAVKYFDMEAKTYPESQVLMTRLTQAAKSKTNKD
jgi:hypothetical protein